jgi:hypothetical protein
LRSGERKRARIGEYSVIPTRRFRASFARFARLFAQSAQLSTPLRERRSPRASRPQSHERNRSMTKASLSLLACFTVSGAIAAGCGSSSSNANSGDDGTSPTKMGSSTSSGSSSGTGFGSSSGTSSGSPVGTSSGVGDDAGDDGEASADDGGDATTGDDAGDDAGDATTSGDSSMTTDAAAGCSAASCAGCCDSTGTCQAGGATTACGSNGATCSNCGAGTCGAGVCIGGGAPADSGSAAQCTGVTCFAPDDCVYLQAFITVSGGPNCNFTMCSYASGRGICQ